MALLSRVAVAITLVVSAVGHAAEQPYPARPVRIMAPAIGTTADLLSRQIGQRLNETWGKPVIVDNRAAAVSGAVIRAAITAAPDGYTFVMGETNNLTVVINVYDKPPYDPLTELVPVTVVARAPLVFLTHPSVPVSDLRELIAYAKQRPGKLTYGSSAAGGIGHVFHGLLTQTTAVDILHVPYKGAAAAMLALISGEIQLSSGATSTAMGQIKSGKVKALAVTGAKRSPSLPDVPTAAESGLPELQVDLFFALAAPARTPAAIVMRVNRDVTEVLTTPAIRERIAALGAEASPSTPEQLSELMRREIARWAKVTKAAGIRIE